MPNRAEKLDYISQTKFQALPFERVHPDEKGNWINLTDNDFETFIPVCSKEVKSGKVKLDFPDFGQGTIFELFSLGVSTNRDEWVFDFDEKNLRHKVQFFIEKYNELLTRSHQTSSDLPEWDTIIKWSEHLKTIFKRNQYITFDESLIKVANYRPFIKQFYYAEKFLSDRLTQNHYDTFGNSLQNNNIVITISQGNRGNFFTLAVDKLTSLDIYLPNAANYLPIYRYDGEGQRVDNITDWALGVFRERYKQPSPLAPLPGGEGNFDDSLSPWERAGVREITKKDIFHYVYAVLHNPAYRAKYETNLKREFPRIPMYDDFWQWAAWGEKLLGWHVGYEKIEPYPLKRKDKAPSPQPSPFGRGSQVDSSLPLGEGLGVRAIPKLRADKEAGVIEIDSETTLHGIPPLAWEYKLGNRSALEWVLDQYKEKTARDETIQAEFNSYRLADYKADVIDLLGRLCTVSVETMRIVGEMTEYE